MQGRQKILVVDDDAAVVEHVVRVLTGAGYEVRTAVDDENLQQALTFLPQLILMDVHILGMDGIEVSQHLKATPATTYIPIIGMTASAIDGETRLALAVEEMLQKPFGQHDLLAMIRRFI